MDRTELENLIAKCALGDRAAFDALYTATSAKLFGVILRVLKTRAEAEEVLQEVYVKIWQKADRYAAGGFSPMTWLITIARNAAIDAMRRRKGGTETLSDTVVDTVADMSPGPEAQAVKAGERARLMGCMSELEPDRAEAVQAAYLEGDSYADLADRYDVPINTMRTWLRRSLLKLRECLSQ
ncbi:MAG: sigma-70 family RNA polymerase sigma factor [Pseudomonadota bacterium]